MLVLAASLELQVMTVLTELLVSLVPTARKVLREMTALMVQTAKTEPPGQ